MELRTLAVKRLELCGLYAVHDLRIVALRHPYPPYQHQHRRARSRRRIDHDLHR